MQNITGALMMNTSRSFQPDGQLKSIGSLSSSSFKQKQQHLLDEMHSRVPFDKTHSFQSYSLESYLPTIQDYLGDSQIQTESPRLPDGYEGKCSWLGVERKD